MTWSYRITTFAGIELKVHATFAIIVGLAAANWASQGIAGMAFGAGLVLLLFACIVLHEFGHALAAKWYGIPVKEIVLLPIGGVAFLGRAVREPLQELVIAAAGPLVNVLLLAGLLPALWLMDQPLGVTSGLTGNEAAGPSLTYALAWLARANVGLVLFNLIPAFPLDGGRMLRGVLGLLTDWTRATTWATATGRYLAVAMGVWAVVSGHIGLAFIALFVFMGAAATAAEERGHTVLSSFRIGDACNRHALVLGASDRVSTVVSYLLTSYQPDFAVVAGPRLLGIVRRSQVVEALALHAGHLPVSAIMRECPTVPADMTLADVRRALVEAAASVAAVYEGARFIGLVSLDDIAEAETVLTYSRRDLASPPTSGGTRIWPKAGPVEA